MDHLSQKSPQNQFLKLPAQNNLMRNAHQISTDSVGPYSQSYNSNNTTVLKPKSSVTQSLNLNRHKFYERQSHG